VLALGLAALAAGVALMLAARSRPAPGAAVPAASSAVTAPPVLAGAADVSRLLDGIPQSGVVLGSPTAPVTVLEYADLQCPYCRAWATYAFPRLVEDYVRPGKVKRGFRGLAFLGPDSERALRVALAAGLQGKLWNVVDLLYRNQGHENSGWVTDRLLSSVAAAAALDPARVERDRAGAAVRSAIAETAREADAHRITGTPSFVLGRTGARVLRRFSPARLDAASFTPALDALLR